MSRESITVGVNLLWLVPGVVGGSEESTVAALRALGELAPADIEVRLFALGPLARAHPELVEAFPTSLLAFSGRPRPLRIAAESTWLAARTRGMGLVHHAGGTAPLVRAAPAVLTVHDLQPLEREGTHSRLKRAYLGARAPRSVRAARLTITPSEFVRDSVIARTGVDPARVVVVPHSWGHRPPPSPADEVARRYRLDGPVVLYPAITYPHKNHAVLLDAFARLLRRHPDAVLVLTGAAGGAEAEVRSRVEELGIGARVRRPGRVPAADLMALLDAAAVLAWPSRYEGFGVPIGEAMARGLPVVAARAAAIPEVVGDAGLLLAPDDAGDWADALAELLEDQGRRADLAERGRRRAADRWAPRQVGAALAGAYRQAAAIDPPGGRG